MVKVSIIVPVYNVKDYLERSINSVLNQSYKNWELILIDDGSTDGSAEICDRYSSENEKIVVKHQKNSGSGIARQNGVDIAKGEYLCFLDPDDYLNKKALENNVSIISSSNPDVIVNGYYQIQKSMFNKIRIEKKTPKIVGYYNIDEFKQVFKQYIMLNPRSLWNKLYKKSFLFESGIKFTDQRVGQDALYNFEVYRYVNNIYIDNNAYYYYDTLREGSAVKKYNPNRVQYEINIINSYKKLFNSWGEIENYNDIILNEYWNLVMMELKNINNNSGKLKMDEKIAKINNLLDIDEVNNAISELNNQNNKKVSQLLFLKLIKKKNYWLMIGIVKLYINLVG